MKLYNTLTRKKETFEPQDGKTDSLSFRVGSDLQLRFERDRR